MKYGKKKLKLTITGNTKKTIDSIEFSKNNKKFSCYKKKINF